MGKLIKRDIWNFNKIFESVTGVKPLITESLNKIQPIVDKFRSKRKSFQMGGNVDSFYDMILNTVIPQLERVVDGTDDEDIAEYYPKDFTADDFMVLINTLKQPEFSGNNIGEATSTGGVNTSYSKPVPEITDIEGIKMPIAPSTLSGDFNEDKIVEGDLEYSHVSDASSESDNYTIGDEQKISDSGLNGNN